MPLTTRQALALETLDWLLDPSDGARASGRTYVTAIAYIRMACRSPGRWISVHDLQSDQRRAHEHLLHTIMAIVGADGRLHEGRPFRQWVSTIAGDHRFRFGFRTPLLDWRPHPEDVVAPSASVDTPAPVTGVAEEPLSLWERLLEA